MSIYLGNSNDKAGNLTEKSTPEGIYSYEYDAQQNLVKGTNPDGETSVYVYDALGNRIKNTQTRENINTPHSNTSLTNGSSRMKDYTPALSDGRETSQRTWETEVGTTVQSETEVITKEYVVDFLAAVSCDIMVYEEGRYSQRNVFDSEGALVSSEFEYTSQTLRGTAGENIASDIAVNDISRIWYRRDRLNTALYAVDDEGKVVTHAIYDSWGNPQTETNLDLNFSGIEMYNLTGHEWDEVLGMYFAQNRFYDPSIYRFTQKDTVKDGINWYLYCLNDPLNRYDPDGLRAMNQGIGGGKTKKKNVFKPAPPPPRPKAPSYQQQNWAAEDATNAAAAAKAAAAKAAEAKARAEKLAKEEAEKKRQQAIRDKLMRYRLYGGSCRTLQDIARGESKKRLLESQLKIAALLGLNALAGWHDEDKIKEDLKNLNWDNTDFDKVSAANLISSYQGTLIIKQSFEGGSLQFGNTILLDAMTREEDLAVTISHEWGHWVQEANMGQGNYIVNVAIPSLIGSRVTNVPQDEYFNQSWEYEADVLGGAKWLRKDPNDPTQPYNYE